MKTDGRSPTISSASTVARSGRQSRSLRKSATVWVAACGTLALLHAVVHGQERAPSPMAIQPPPPSLTPADTGWTASGQTPAPLPPPPTAKPRPRSEVGTASDLPPVAAPVAPVKQAVVPATPIPTTPVPVRRELLRASYQEEIAPLQAIPTAPTAPTTPEYVPTPWRQQVQQSRTVSAAPTPPALPTIPTAPVQSALPQQTQQAATIFRPVTVADYAVAQGQAEPPAIPPVKVQGKVPETMPVPRPAAPFGPDQVRLPAIADIDTPLGRTPVPSAKDIAEYNALVGPIVDPHLTFDLVLDRVRIMQLKSRPIRTQIGDASIVEYNFIGQKALDVAFIGKQVGSTVFNVWFEDPNDRTKEKILSFLVRVIPDPERRQRLENVYKQLEKEINCQFPNSVVCLRLVGDKVCVSGQAYDIGDATKILQLVAASSPNYSQNKTNRATNREKADPSKIPVSPIGANGIPGLNDYIVSPDSDIINQLRIGGEQQVMLRVTVAEVNRSAARSIGVNFSIMNRGGTTVFSNQTGQIGQQVMNGTSATTSSVLSNLPIALDTGRINIAINALRTLNYARSLAEPNIMAANGQTATFQAGGQFPVPVVAGNQFNQSQGIGVSFVPFGVLLNFTPFITDKDRVRLNMSATVSTRDLSTGAAIANTNVPGLNTRNFQTTVEIREGQTLAVAGLIQNNLGTDSNRIPGIGDIPFLTNLTGFASTQMAEQELIVLVTPELHHSIDHRQLPPLPGADLIEPSDCEFYVIGRLEGRRGKDYRSPVMTDIDRMIRFHRCEEQYIFGPTGFTPHP
jgi:pilus assembly protein CpaC